jgi:hypothetical protein
VCVLDSGAVDRRFVPWSGLTNGYQIGICCFSSKHAALRRTKSKDRLARNPDIVSEWGDIYIGCVSELAQIRVGLVQSGSHASLIEK